MALTKRKTYDNQHRKKLRKVENPCIQVAISFRLEGHEPDDFGKVVVMERIRGELTDEQARKILLEQLPEETARIKAKVARPVELGLSWKEL